MQNNKARTFVQRNPGLGRVRWLAAPTMRAAPCDWMGGRSAQSHKDRGLGFGACDAAFFQPRVLEDTLPPLQGLYIRSLHKEDKAT